VTKTRDKTAPVKYTKAMMHWSSKCWKPLLLVYVTRDLKEDAPCSSLSSKTTLLQW